MDSTANVSAAEYPLGSKNLLPESSREWLEALLLALVYVVLARAGQTLAIAPGNITPVWLPSGVIFAALLLRGYYLWPGIFFGAAIGNAWAYFDPNLLDVAIRSLCSATLNGVGDVACAWVGAHAVRKQLERGEPYMNVVTCVYFVVYAVLIGPFISAAFGVGGLLAFDFLSVDQFAVALLTWLTGDAVGVLIVGSLLLVWKIPRDNVLEISNPNRSEYLMFLLSCLALLIVSLLFIFGSGVFSSGFPLMFLLPILSWSILRLGSRWTFATTSLIAAAAIVSFAVHYSGSDEVAINTGLVLLQSFIAVLVITVMLISSVSYQWADAYQRMEDARSSAEQSSRFKSNFLSSVSHELRTPMNGVVGFTDLLHNTDLVEVQVGYVDGIEKSARHMMTLIDELLDLAKAESGEIKLNKINFSPASLLDETAELFEHQLHQNTIRLHVQVDQGLPDWLIADTKLIKQILLNFISNAFKFTNAGKITLTVEKEYENWLRFSVTDTGIGISELEQQHIFEPFAQASHNQMIHGGTGLGLYICSRLARSMNGNVGVESIPGQGSTFWFQIPLIEGTAIEESAQKLTLDQFQPLDLFVLVVEDNPVNSRVVCKMLDRFGCQYLLADNGEVALELAARQHFDIILMDCMMPVMDGCQASRIIRKESELNQRTPIIALTANAMRENRDRCVEYGMNDFLTKPINAKQLYLVLSRYNHFDPLSVFDKPT